MEGSGVVYAGIGARTAPAEVLELMEGLAERLAGKGWVLRSGRAKGADSAFERGCDRASGRKEIYLHWPGYGGLGWAQAEVRLDGPPAQAFEIARGVVDG